jgi:MFS family permease
MELGRYLQARNWPALFGYLLFVGMMAAGYYYNLTFVQLGLVDLGERVVGLTEAQVAGHMALLAVLTCVVGLITGWVMKRTGWTSRLRVKLRLAFGVVLVQTVLTVLALLVQTPQAFLAWIVLGSIALGVGVPATFSTTVDLVPVRDRGLVAAAITAIAYFGAAVFSTQWQIERFAWQSLAIMPVGVVGLGVLAFARLPLVDRLAGQHREPAFDPGRYVRLDARGRERISRSLLGLIALMFAVYFIDSLGFLRLLKTPVYMNTAWQSPEEAIRLFIGITHVVAALCAGVLYVNLELRSLFLWIFGIFALVHLMYGFHNRLTPQSSTTLSMTMLYATAVSLYTVVNFAIWADVSTARTISLNSAVGVALSAWPATFVSTALAMRWQYAGMPLQQHLNIVDALAMLCFAAMLVLVWLQPGARAAAPSGSAGSTAP